METKLITLDKLYGFGIYLTEYGAQNNKNIRNRGRIVCDTNNVPLMFNNAKIAILMADINLGLNKRDFKLKVIKFENKKNKITTICNFESMQDMSSRYDPVKTYQVITKDMIYYVKEQRIEKVRSIRYFVFENGDTERTSRSYGKHRNTQLLNLIRKAATDYFYVSGILAGVKKVSSDEYEISFKNTTTKIHIMTNGLIASINKNRKETGYPSQYQRCIPFDQNLDKYTTIFSFVTREFVEPDGFGYYGSIDDDVERVYKYIEDYIFDMSADDIKLHGFKYRPIEFNGTILCKE